MGLSRQTCHDQLSCRFHDDRRAVLIVEHNAILGLKRSLTIPYDSALSRYEPGSERPLLQRFTEGS